MSAITEIYIDPNVRVASNQTYAGFEDVQGPIPHVGAQVTVREPESGLVGTARVTRVHRGDGLVYLAVDWSSLVPEELPTPDQLVQRLNTCAWGRGPFVMQKPAPSASVRDRWTVASRAAVSA